MKFPPHMTAELVHNQHKVYYEKIEDYLRNHLGVWSGPESRQRAIDTDEIWELQWYPTTPIGCYLVCAPTLEEVLKLAEGK